jgi:hypothetical protein
MVSDVRLLVCVLVLCSIALAQTHGIQFSWSESTAGTTFNLYCSTTSNGQVLGSPQVSGITASPYLWTSGTPGTKYYCKVTAVNSLGEESGFSNQATQTFPGPPSAPSSLTAVQK